MQTLIIKNMRGNWEAKTTIDLKIVEGKKHILELYTSKNSGGVLYTSASVSKVENGFVSYILYQDFYKIINRSKERCTQKAVENLHNEAKEKIEEIKKEAVAFYKKS